MNIHQADPEKLLSAAQRYLALGWSVIPTQDKVAALSWTVFQKQRASLEQVQQWFSKGQFLGLAILTGIISQLTVLDFDDPTLLKRFSQRFPHLMSTRIVQTRRGFHLYYRVPSGSALRSLKLPGLDVQYNGRYVMAPPSVVGDYTYIATRDQMPYLLTLADIAALLQFFSELQAESPSAKVAPPPHIPSKPPYRFSARELIALYLEKASQGGRNLALFWIGCLARDHGYSLEQTCAIITDVHVAQQARGRHRRESPSQRKREAHATLRSVYRRPAQPGRVISISGQLPNIIREALLQRGALCVVRTLETLRLKGIQPGQSFTEKQALALLSDIVGRHSLRKTLGWVLEGSQPLVEALPSSSPPPGVSDTAFVESPVSLSPNALRGEKKPDKLKTGPQPRQFIMPDNAALAQRLGVKYRVITDPVSQESLRSVRQTRMALHARFIERAPGQYAMQFLAWRLSVTKRTLQNYHALLPDLQREATYERQPISWHTLNRIPEELPHGGFFLTDQNGKKYPAKPGIAKRLLGEKQLQLTLNRQLPNIFWYGARLKPTAVVAVQEKLDMFHDERRQKQREWILQKLKDREAAVSPVGAGKAEIDKQKSLLGVPSSPAMARPKHVIIPALPKKRRISGKRCLSKSDEEGAAQHLYQIINQMSLDKEGQVSLTQARKIIVKYGSYQTLNVLWRIEKRIGVRKPIGLLCTILRCEQKYSTHRR